MMNPAPTTNENAQSGRLINVVEACARGRSGEGYYRLTWKEECYEHANCQAQIPE